MIKRLFARVMAIPFNLGQGLVFLAIAAAIAFTNNGTMMYLERAFRITNDFMAALFGFGAAVLFLKPNKLGFVLAGIPMAMYLAAGVSYVAARQVTGMAAVLIYVSMMLTFPIVYRFGLEGVKMPIDVIYGTMTLMLGLAVMSAPSRAATQWAENNYGLSVTLIGASLTLTAAYLLLSTRTRAFVINAVLLMIYAALTVGFAVATGNIIGGLVNLSFFMVVLGTTYNIKAYLPPPLVTIEEGV